MFAGVLGHTVWIMHKQRNGAWSGIQGETGAGIVKKKLRNREGSKNETYNTLGTKRLRFSFYLRKFFKISPIYKFKDWKIFIYILLNHFPRVQPLPSENMDWNLFVSYPVAIKEAKQNDWQPLKMAPYKGMSTHAHTHVFICVCVQRQWRNLTVTPFVLTLNTWCFI